MKTVLPRVSIRLLPIYLYLAMHLTVRGYNSCADSRLVLLLRYCVRFRKFRADGFFCLSAAGTFLSFRANRWRKWTRVKSSNRSCSPNKYPLAVSFARRCFPLLQQQRSGLEWVIVPSLSNPSDAIRREWDEWNRPSVQDFEPRSRCLD